MIPNHPRFPVLVYRGVEWDDARALLAAHGWGGAWVNGVFDFHHFHSTSHEVLAVISGSATLELGGPQGAAFEVAAGDVLVLPGGYGTPARARRRRLPRGRRVPARARRTTTSCARPTTPRASGSPRCGAPAEDPVGGEGVAGWR